MFMMMIGSERDFTIFSHRRHRVGNEQRKKKGREEEVCMCVVGGEERKRKTRAALRIYITWFEAANKLTEYARKTKNFHSVGPTRTKYKIDDSAFSVQQQAIDAMKMIMSPTVTSSIWKLLV